MPSPRVTLLSKPGCHLCDDARETLTTVLAEAEFALGFDEISILDRRELAERFSEEIPVVLIDGDVHTIWRVEPDRLRVALRKATV